MIDEALVLQEAGASFILLECVPSELAQTITEQMEVAVIGIGAGPQTDGQIMVLHDLLGLYPGRPAKFVKNFLKDSADVQNGNPELCCPRSNRVSFPAPEHCYS